MRKKRIWIGMLGCLLCLLTACGKAGNLLGDASPNTSAMELYYFDGTRMVVRTLYDSAREKEILKSLNALPAKELKEDALSNWQVPCYGLWIGSEDGTDICVAYCDGMWLDEEGNLYQVDVDFEEYFNLLEGEDESDDRSVLLFPNAGRLAAYDIRFMEKAQTQETETEDGISALPLGTVMTVTDMDHGIATVLIDNQSGYEISYGEHYSLQKEIDGEWYILPIAKTNIVFHDIAYILQDLSQATVTCDLTIFGELEAGNYRLIKDDMTAEFALDEEGNLIAR